MLLGTDDIPNDFETDAPRSFERSIVNALRQRCTAPELGGAHFQELREAIVAQMHVGGEGIGEPFYNGGFGGALGRRHFGNYPFDL